MDNKLSTLHAYRKAHGLCIHCAEKWAPGHKCSPQLQLHVLQEFWDLCNEDTIDQVSSPSEEPHPTPEADISHHLYMVSAAALSSKDHPRTLQFKGTIQDQKIVILVDSGSTHSFLSSSVASKLTGVQALPIPVAVKIADGGSLSCVAELSSVEWSVQGVPFHSNLKILPLGIYDMILGMDWLEAFSPMKINWQHKLMSITYGHKQLVLHGTIPDTPECSVVQLFHIAADTTCSEVVAI